MVDDIGLSRIREQNLAQTSLGLVEAAELFQKSTPLDAQRDPHLIGLDRAALGRQRSIRVAGHLKQQAEVDRGGVQVRPQQEGVAIGDDGIRGLTFAA